MKLCAVFFTSLTIAGLSVASMSCDTNQSSASRSSDDHRVLRPAGQVDSNDGVGDNNASKLNPDSTRVGSPNGPLSGGSGGMSGVDK